MKKTLFLILLCLFVFPNIGFNQMQSQFPSNFYRHSYLPIKVWPDTFVPLGFHFLDDQIGFIFTRLRSMELDSNIVLWRTQDGGQSWSAKKFDQYLFMYENGQEIIRESPSGRIYFTSSYLTYDFVCHPNNGGLRYQLNYSDDLGVTWNKKDIGQFDEYERNTGPLNYIELSENNFLFQKKTIKSLCGNYSGVYGGNDISNPIHLNGDTPVDIAIDTDSSYYWYWSYDQLVRVDTAFNRTNYPAFIPIANYDLYSIHIDGEWIRIFHKVNDPTSLGAGNGCETGVFSFNRTTGERTYKLLLSTFKKNITQVNDLFFLSGIEYFDFSDDSLTSLNYIERDDFWDNYYVKDYHFYQWITQDTGFIMGYNSQVFNSSYQDSTYVLFKTTNGQPTNYKVESFEANAGTRTELDFSNYVEIHPNPSTDYITIQSIQNIDAIRIFNDLGQIVLVSPELSTDRKILVQDFPPGLYLIQIQLGNDEFVNKRFIKK